MKFLNPKAAIDRVSCHLKEQTSHCVGRGKKLSVLVSSPPPSSITSLPQSPISLERTLQVQVCRWPVLPLPQPDLTSLPAAGPLGTQPASDGIPEKLAGDERAFTESGSGWEKRAGVGEAGATSFSSEETETDGHRECGFRSRNTCIPAPSSSSPAVWPWPGHLAALGFSCLI